ncbi:MAG: hypothetical protein AAB454_01235 [Patescibacteria group bacterium]
MKRPFSIFTTIILTFAFTASAAFAQPKNAGLLPTNPFYFLKEWGRGIKLVLSVKTIRKAEVVLGILNSKALEIKALSEINAMNREAIQQAMVNYQDSAAEFELLLGQLSQLDSLLEKILAHAVNYPEIVDAKILDIILSKTDSPLPIIRQLTTLIHRQNNPWTELAVAELIDRLENRAPLLKLQEDLLIVFNGRLQANLSQDNGSFLLQIKQVFGSQLLRIVSLDQMREMLPASDLKNQLSVIRQQILESQESGIGELQVLAAIQTVKELAKEMKNKKLTEQIEFLLSQAESLVEDGNYAAAFGQVSVTSTIVKNNIIQQLTDFDAELDEVKARFDELSGIVRNLDLEQNITKILKELLLEAERRIIRLDQRPSLSLLRNTKLLLAIIDELRGY